MANFPRLKTGVSVQYPVSISVVSRTHITRFLDGSEQRYGEYLQPVRRWEIRLNRLDEEEARNVQAFFEEQSGAYGVFAFEDPITGQTYSACSFDRDNCSMDAQGENRIRTMLTVRTVA